MCFLTLYDDEFWLKEKRYGAVFAFEATVLTAQIGCLFYEYSKNVPLMWPHKAYWFTYFLVDGVELIYILLEVVA
jgi:hypothetical protein